MWSSPNSVRLSPINSESLIYLKIRSFPRLVRCAHITIFPAHTKSTNAQFTVLFAHTSQRTLPASNHAVTKSKNSLRPNAEDCYSLIKISWDIGFPCFAEDFFFIFVSNECVGLIECRFIAYHFTIRFKFGLPVIPADFQFPFARHFG